MRKRLTAVLIVLTLVLGATLPGLAVQAQGASLDEATMALLEETLHQGLCDFQEKISLYDLKITYSKDLFWQINDMINDYNDVYYVSQISTSILGTYFYNITPTYTDTKENVVPKINAAKEAANDMIADLDGLTDLEKALILHDRLALAVEYDIESASTGAPAGSDCYSMYGALVDHLAVCEGYTAAYSYMLDLLGIANRKCRSDNLNHVWNILTINGQEYHVDVTHDDPMINGEDRIGVVYHENFLRSSAGIYATDSHYLPPEYLDYDVTPSDTTYDGYFWQNVKTGFQLVNGKLYYIDAATAQLKRWTGEEESEPVFDLPDKWTANGGYYGGCFSKLAGNGRYLIYNTDAAICGFDPETGENKVIFEPERGGNEWVYAVRVSGNRLDYTLAESPNLKGTVYSVPLGYERGDLNGDLSLNAQDRVLLSRYLANWDVEIADESQMDINRDGAVTAVDRAILARFLAGWGVPYDSYFN